MSFQNWIKDGGLWLGLALRFSKLGKNEEFLNSLSFAAWRSICRRRLSAGKTICNVAAYKMAGLAGANFNCWWSVYWAKVSLGLPEGVALENIQKTAKNFDDYRAIYVHLDKLPWAKPFALQGMQSVSQDITAWHGVYVQYSNTPIQEIAFQKLVAAKGSFEDWVYVHEHTWEESPLHAIALHKMFDLAKTADQWHHVFNNSSGTLERLAYQKIQALTQE